MADQKEPQKMTRLLKRALDNLHEDAASFGFTKDS
jgi:hypothetical protein